jgi:L-amino acid N-acyltransferase YncA
MENTFEIRLINEADAHAVLTIYKYYVDHTIISFEYEVPSLEEYLQRINVNTEKYPWLVCLNNNKIIGFAYGSTHRYRTAYQWSPESTIYLATDFHTKGIGRILYKTLFEILKLQGYYNVFAGVALPNQKSIGFHQAMSFEEIGIFKKVGYKHGNWHDTHWFQLSLNEYKPNPTTPQLFKDIVQTNEFVNIMNSANTQLNKT